MNAVILIVSVGVEYPSLLSTVDRVGVVGCIPALQFQHLFGTIVVELITGVL